MPENNIFIFFTTPYFILQSFPFKMSGSRSLLVDVGLLRLHSGAALTDSSHRLGYEGPNSVNGPSVFKASLSSQC